MAGQGGRPSAEKFSDLAGRGTAGAIGADGRGAGAVADQMDPVVAGHPGESPPVHRDAAAGGADWHSCAHRAAATGAGAVAALSRAMTVRLHLANLADEPAVLTEALHNYLRVSDATDVHVEGLSGKSYEDKFDDLRVKTQDGDWRLPDDVPRSDRLYPDAGGTYRLVDPGRGRTIRVTGDRARTAVVWNPGADVASGMADVGPHWREFVCVETANAGPDVQEPVEPRAFALPRKPLR